MSEHPMKTAKSRVQTHVHSAADEAADVARKQAEAVTTKVTDHVETKVSNAANAAAAASSEFEAGSFQAQASEQIAAHLSDFAGVLQQTDFDTAARKAASFARENPAIVLGGAALLGFAAVRFLKASEQNSAAPAARDRDPWTGHVTGTYPAPETHSDAPTRPEHYRNGGALS